MGDDGSQFLGFMIAVIPLYTSSGNSFEFNKFLIMIIVTSFPVFDTIAAIWRRLRDHKPIMSPDRSHLHHKLLNLGYSKTQALYLIAFIQTLLCLVVVLSSFLGNLRGSTVLFEALVFMVIFFSVIHYTNRAVYRKFLLHARRLYRNHISRILKTGFAKTLATTRFPYSLK